MIDGHDKKRHDSRIIQSTNNDPSEQPNNPGLGVNVIKRIFWVYTRT